LLKIIEKFESNPDRYRVASGEYLDSMKYLKKIDKKKKEKKRKQIKKTEDKKSRKSQIFMERMILTIAGAKGSLADEYNTKGKDTRCLVKESRFICLEVLRNECLGNGY